MKLSEKLRIPGITRVVTLELRWKSTGTHHNQGCCVGVDRVSAWEVGRIDNNGLAMAQHDDPAGDHLHLAGFSKVFLGLNMVVSLVRKLVDKDTD